MTDQLAGRTPRILVLGDLHADTWGRLWARVLEETGLGQWILENAPDLLIVAGDIANNPTWNWHMALLDIADYVSPQRVVIIPSNHDYYRFSLDGDDELRRIAQQARMRFAQKEEIRIGNVRIFCCTLWTDFAFNGTPCSGQCRDPLRSPDASGRWSVPDAPLHAETLASVCSRFQ
jgi:predicted phosphodiesterase